VENLKILGRNCQRIILWLDCNHEGEAIASEVVEICQKVNPSIQCSRAQLSALTDHEIHQAIKDLKAPNYNLAAVRI